MKIFVLLICIIPFTSSADDWFKESKKMSIDRAKNHASILSQSAACMEKAGDNKALLACKNDQSEKIKKMYEDFRTAQKKRTEARKKAAEEKRKKLMAKYEKQKLEAEKRKKELEKKQKASDSEKPKKK